MKRMARMIACGATVLVFCGAAARAEEPSIEKGVEEVGDAIADDGKAAARETDVEVKKGVHASERGVGDALQKTGEGMDAAGEKVHEKGE